MLFEQIVYGPIHSRRLGVSLGMNVMPLRSKRCSFDCVYCECGFNPSPEVDHAASLPTREEVKEALEKKLLALREEGVTPDVITFSGNGEPTLHPEFLGIVRDTCLLRDTYCPSARVSLLTNSTRLGDPHILEAVKLCDNRILKLDSAVDSTMRLIDQPVNERLTVARIVELLEQFEGQFTLQTCFLRGDVLAPNPSREGHYVLGHIDNTTPEELEAWYAVVRRLRPHDVMIYVIDRQTPVPTLEKIAPDTMHAIARVLEEEGVRVSVSC